MSANDNLASCIVNKIGKLWEDNVLSDLKIIIDDVIFNCHRFHLSACSDFFRVMFQSDEKAFFNDVTTVTIKGIASETFRLILVSVYKGELTVNSENMLDLWHASHHFQIDFLVNKLEYFISRNIKDENFIAIYTLAVELNSYTIMKSVHSFIAKNFDKISRTDDFLNMSFNCLLAVLGHDDLDVKSRDDLVTYVLNWVDHKPSSMNRTEKVLKGNDVGLKDKKIQDEQQMLHTTQGRKTTNTIDVVFKSRDDLKYKVESSTQRKDNLSDLMKIINLNDVSQDCLLALLNNDDIMECREARTLVRQAFTDRKDNKPLVRKITSAKISSTSELIDTEEDFQFDKPKIVEDTAPVVVYIQEMFGGILAYNLETGKTRLVPRNGLPLDWSIRNVYSHKNQLYITMVKSQFDDHPLTIFKMHSNGQWEFLTDGPKKRGHLMFNDKYIYYVVDYRTLCRLNIECLDSLVWVHVYDIPFNSGLVMSGNKLLYENKDTFTNDSHPNLNEPMKANAIQYIDLKSLTIGYWDKCIPKKECILSQVESFDGDELFMSTSGVIMEHSHLLTNKGRLLHVTHPSDTSLKVIPEEILFANDQTAIRVVPIRYKSTLYLFKPRAVDVCELTNRELTSFSEIRVVPLLNASSNCVPLMAPKHWLTREI